MLDLLEWLEHARATTYADDIQPSVEVKSLKKLFLFLFIVFTNPNTVGSYHHGEIRLQLCFGSKKVITFVFSGRV